MKAQEPLRGWGAGGAVPLTVEQVAQELRATNQREREPKYPYRAQLDWQEGQQQREGLEERSEQGGGGLIGRDVLSRGTSILLLIRDDSTCSSKLRHRRHFDVSRC